MSGSPRSRPTARRSAAVPARIGPRHPYVVLLSDEQPGEDARLAQQPLEALMRRRLPAFERAARIRIDAGRLDPHQQLPALYRQRPIRRPPRSGSESCRDLAVGREGRPVAPARLDCRRRAAPPSRALLQRTPRGRLNPGSDESSPTCAAMTAVSAWVCRDGARPSSLSRTGATTKPTGRT